MAATFKAGDLVTSSEFNKLFQQLEDLRKVHAAANGLSDAQRSALSTAYNTNIAVQNSTVTTSVPTTLKNDIINLENSPYLSGFSSQITIPSVGSLLQYSTSTSWQSTITAMQAACANCPHHASNYSSNYSSNFNDNSHRASNFSDFSDNSHRSSNFSDFGNFSNNSSNYGNRDNRSAFSDFSNRGNFVSNKCSGKIKLSEQSLLKIIASSGENNL